MKTLLFCILVAITTSVWAAPAKLTPEQIEQVIQTINTVQSADPAKVSSTSASIRTEATEWAAIGANIGNAMVSAAREIGVAANDFSQTSLGKITTIIIAYKIIGRDILGVIVGTAILVCLSGLGIWVIFGPCLGNREYETRPVLWGMCTIRTIKQISFSDEARVTKVTCGIILILISVAVGLNTIF